MGAPLGICSVSDENTTRSQSNPIDDDCPLTAICSTRHRHGKRRTGLNSEHATQSEWTVVSVVPIRSVSERRNFILKVKLII